MCRPPAPSPFVPRHAFIPVRTCLGSFVHPTSSGAFRHRVRSRRPDQGLGHRSVRFRHKGYRVNSRRWRPEARWAWRPENRARESGNLGIWAKKRGGDGHITSPISPRPGREPWLEESSGRILPRSFSENRKDISYIFNDLEYPSHCRRFHRQ